MSKHKSADYKLTNVKYYLKCQSSLDEVCLIIKQSTLKRKLKNYKD